MKSIDEKIELLRAELAELEAEKEKNPDTIGERIRKEMRNRGISCAEMVRKVGLSQQTLFHYALFRSNIPAVILGEIAKVLGVSCDYLIFGEEKENG